MPHQELPAATCPVLPEQGRRPYQQPVLTRYGSVRLLTGNGQGSGSDAMAGIGMAMQSDVRCKTALRRIGEHPLGFGLYLYEYLPAFCNSERRKTRFGVLAQEVAGVCPEVVSRAQNGYLQVDYARLGIHPHMP